MAPPRGPQPPHYVDSISKPGPTTPPGPDPRSTVGALWVIPGFGGCIIGTIVLAAGGSGAAIGIIIAGVLLSLLTAAIRTAQPAAPPRPRADRQPQRVMRVRHKPRPWGAL